ncbi:amylo-alpha-1,6-glucosidase [Solidesulfovibrio sp.]
MSDANTTAPGQEACDAGQDPHRLREWLVTNGLGGYASGTVTGAITRRYHGLLVAALPNPLGRVMMVNGLSERLRLPSRRVVCTGAEELAGVAPESVYPLTAFCLDHGLPVWRYEIDGFVLEKRLLMPYQQNTVHVTYRLLRGEGMLRLNLRPALQFRSHDALVGPLPSISYRLSVFENRFEITGEPNYPILRLQLTGPATAFTVDGKVTATIPYRTERDRGYAWKGSLWSPGYFRTDLEQGQETTLIASTEGWDAIEAQSPEAAYRSESERCDHLLRLAGPALQSGPAAQLVLAADQFLITPVGRVQDAVRAKAAGDDVRTIIAGYHWFTDWGRDTMISLEGLTLLTGRINEAGWILRTFAEYIRNGLIPNMFPEGEAGGLYHTADATLWFFHAFNRYLGATNDQATLRLLLPKFQDIIEHHWRGTDFGIAVDPADGLLRQGAPGYQLTWMDAKVDDWVVTPRRGKAVEINALWYNALRLLEGWLAQSGDAAAADAMGQRAEQVRDSFNNRFWFASGGYLYDVVDGETGGDDAACRPNQVLAISLDHPVLNESRWSSVMAVVTRELLTPVGLRSLAPGHPDYKAHYYGDLRSRDAAYHQGTVWAWLIGPYVEAWLKLHPGRQAEAREFLAGLMGNLDAACVGSLSEVFDAEPPYLARGCIAQAWSVAETLRCWVMTETAAQETAPG